MKLQKLISVLAKQEINLNNLLQIGLDKKESLVSNKYEVLNEVVANEEQTLLFIQMAEEKRLNLMHDLFSEYNIDNERYKIEILVENLKGKIEPKILQSISDSEKRIKQIIGEITRINQLNMVLIQQSRSLINDIVQAVINSSDRSILDRKG